MAIKIKHDGQLCRLVVPPHVGSHADCKAEENDEQSMVVSFYVGRSSTVLSAVGMMERVGPQQRTTRGSV